MRNNTIPNQKFCQTCGAERPAQAERCWMCYSKLGAESAIVNAQLVHDVIPAPPKPATSAGTWWLMLTAAAVVGGLVLYGLFLTAPGFALGLGAIYSLIIVTIALTFQVRSLSKPASAGIQAIRIMGLVILIAVAGVIALFSACYAICFLALQ